MASASSPDRLFRAPDRLDRMIDLIAEEPSMNEGVLAMRERGRFDDATSKMVGIALDQKARQLLDDTLDKFWQHDRTTGAGFASSGHEEVIIGGGYHAAVYARVRHMLGFPKPLVIDDRERPGGTFACSHGPSFYLNSRNRPGPLLTPGERGALNVIPGMPIQPSMLSNDEYQRNNDMAFIIRMALAMSARVVSGAKVKKVDPSSSAKRRWRIELEDGRTVLANRVILASGLGRQREMLVANNDRLLTFEQFMARMDQRFPLRGLNRVAVIGNGDSARCAIEALFGMGPARHWSIPDLDMPQTVDWFGALPETCEKFLAQSRTRYKRIAALLPKADARNVSTPVRPVINTVSAEPGYECAVVNGKPYDLAISCIGYKKSTADIPIAGDGGTLNKYVYASGRNSIILGYAANSYENVYAVGACRDISFSEDEINLGYDRTKENKVAMWRLGGRTARLAQILPAA